MESAAASIRTSSRRLVLDDHGKIRQVGDWVLGATLGKGSFGKVKLAHHHRTNESVAVKIVDKSSISHVDDVERVYRETFILTTLKHPHIIKLYEVLDTPNAIMLVMEYAGGGELYQYIQHSHRLNEIEACRLFTQILEGVEYCHRAKVIHRDLKLENILLASQPSTSAGSDQSLEVKIADFGLSNSIKFNQKLDTNCGTPSYTCPEQIAGHSYIGSAADIWSLGVILFAMIAGFLPFEAANIPALFKRISKCQYKFPTYLSEEAKSMIEAMLTIDPDKRTTIAELRSHSWMLMEYTELADNISRQPLVTEELIEQAKLECQSWTGSGNGNDKAAESDTTASVSTIPSIINRDSISSTVSSDSAGFTVSTIASQPINRSTVLNTNNNTFNSKNRAKRTSDREPRSANSSKASYTVFDKLSIRTNQLSMAGKTGINTGRRSGTESGSSSALNSVRHRKSISSLNGNSAPINGLNSANGNGGNDSKSSTQPITKFPPISPAPQSPALPAHAHSPTLNIDDSSPSPSMPYSSGPLSVSNRRKLNGKFEESKDSSLTARFPPSGNANQRKSTPSSPSHTTSNAITASTPLYMTDTNASRHRLLGKLATGGTGGGEL